MPSEKQTYKNYVNFGQFVSQMAIPIRIRSGSLLIY